MFFRGVLSNCNNAGFVNIGRGNVIKEDEIVEALDNGWLRGAALDVFNAEPLPADCKLWSHPKVTSILKNIFYFLFSNIFLCFSNPPHSWRVKSPGYC